MQGEYRVSVLTLCGVHKALYKITQKTVTELPCALKYRVLTRNVLHFFCAFFLAVQLETEWAADLFSFFSLFFFQRTICTNDEAAGGGKLVACFRRVKGVDLVPGL